MSAKQFFKSTAFKCIAVLLSIVLVCGVLLTICNSLFYVTEQEKFDRAISKIYGKSVDTTPVTVSDYKTEYTYGTINSAYKVEDGNYMVNVSGKGGHGGDIICWVVVDMSSDAKAIDGIYKVVLDKVPSGEFTTKLSSADLNRFSTDYKDGIVYEYGYANGGTSKGSMYVSTGASESYRAISNAVNCALDFVKECALGQSNLSFYEALEFKYLSLIDQNVENTYYTVENGDVNYTITTLGNSPAGAFKLNISVDADKKISAYEMVVNGCVDSMGYDLTYDQYTERLFTEFVGKDISFFTGVIGEDGNTGTNANFASNGIQTGATKSNYQILYAAVFALGRYDNFIANPDM
ncbi:MAG: hypothetical protein ACI4L9_01990, partial [Candidatus Coproplasma sp.]